MASAIVITSEDGSKILAQPGAGQVNESRSEWINRVACENKDVTKDLALQELNNK